MVDVTQGVLFIDGEPQHVQPLPWKLLVAMVEAPRELFDRERLMDLLWPGQVVVADEALSKVVSRLRTVLDEPVVRTIRGRGYRLDADVQPVVTSVAMSALPMRGREHELQQLRTWVQERRPLITILGPAGVGKTRLAQALIPSQIDAIWVDLRAAEDHHGLVIGMAASLGGKATLKSITQTLASLEDVLIVLDNAEQVIDAIRPLIGQIQDAVPHARFLLTSRLTLSEDGEHVLELAPLGLASCVQLIRDRLTTTVGDQELEKVARSVDGLPLSLVVAIARLRALGPQSFLDEIATEGPHPVTRTLSESLSRSWRLTHRDDRHALGRLSAWVASFDLRQANVVLPAKRPAGDVLQSLRDQSWLIREMDGRFRMLPSIRKFVLDHANPTEVHAGSQLHGAWFVTLFSDALDQHGGVIPPRSTIFRTLVEHLDDLIAATRRALAIDDGALAAGCVRAAQCVLIERGPAPLLRTLLETTLAIAPLRDLPSLYAGLANILIWYDEAQQSLSMIEEAVRHAEALGDPQILQLQRSKLAQYTYRAGHWQEGRKLALELLEEPNLDPLAAIHANTTLGWYGIRHSDFAATQHWFGTVYELATHHRQPESASMAVRGLGLSNLQRGRIAVATQQLREYLDYQVDMGRVQQEPDARNHLAIALILDEAWDEGRAELRAALHLATHGGHGRMALFALANFATLEIEAGLPEQAQPHVAQALKDERIRRLPYYELLIRTLGARAMLQAGDLVSASGQLERSEPLLLKLPSGVHAYWWDCKAEAAAYAERWADARRFAERSIEVQPQGLMFNTALRRSCLLATACAQLGDPLAARRWLNEAEQTLAKSDQGPDGQLGREVAATSNRVRA
ncbi:MAG: winged helix-turn-helix domain-containing protein [Myxococcota bacterium]